MVLCGGTRLLGGVGLDGCSVGGTAQEQFAHTLVHAAHPKRKQKQPPLMRRAPTITHTHTHNVRQGKSLRNGPDEPGACGVNLGQDRLFGRHKVTSPPHQTAKLSVRRKARRTKSDDTSPSAASARCSPWGRRQLSPRPPHTFRNIKTPTGPTKAHHYLPLLPQQHAADEARERTNQKARPHLLCLFLAGGRLYETPRAAVVAHPQGDGE